MRGGQLVIYSNNNNNSNDHHHISSSFPSSADECAMMYSAFDKTLANLLGEETKDLVIKTLKKTQGISSDYPCSSIEEMEQALRKVLGKQATVQIMKRFYPELNGQQT